MGILLTRFLDFDPEALEQENWGGEANDESEGSGDEGEHDGREHYVAVGYGENIGFTLFFCFGAHWADKLGNETGRVNCERDKQSC